MLFLLLVVVVVVDDDDAVQLPAPGVIEIDRTQHTSVHAHIPQRRVGVYSGVVSPNARGIFVFVYLCELLII